MHHGKCCPLSCSESCWIVYRNNDHSSCCWGNRQLSPEAVQTSRRLLSHPLITAGDSAVPQLLFMTPLVGLSRLDKASGPTILMHHTLLSRSVRFCTMWPRQSVFCCRGEGRVSQAKTAQRHNQGGTDGGHRANISCSSWSWRVSELCSSYLTLWALTTCVLCKCLQ